MKVLTLLFVGVMAASGCGASPSTYRMTTDRHNFTSIAEEELARPCSSSFRVCVTNPGILGLKAGVQSTRTTEMRKLFPSAEQHSSPNPGLCDLAVSFPEKRSEAIEVVKVKESQPNEFLARFEVGPLNHVVKALCLALAPGGTLAGKVVANPAIAARTAALAAASAPATPVETLTPRFNSPDRPDDLAVIVGIESYSDIASKASYAERDADAFKAHVRALGVPERNIILLKGAKAGKASFIKNIEGWLPRMARPESRVYFYFSGHGAPDVKTGLAYIVPWDGDPNFLDETAYPVAKLYQTLGALPAKQVLVAMDSCFSGAGGRSVMASGARPLVSKIETGAVPAKVTVLAASAANEIAGSLDDKGYGAFTYFFLQGLDAGKTTPKALADYLTPRVQDEARRLNRDQTPQLLGDGSWSLR